MAKPQLNDIDWTKRRLLPGRFKAATHWTSVLALATCIPHFGITRNHREIGRAMRAAERRFAPDLSDTDRTKLQGVVKATSKWLHDDAKEWQEADAAAAGVLKGLAPAKPANDPDPNHGTGGLNDAFAKDVNVGSAAAPISAEGEALAAHQANQSRGTGALGNGFAEDVNVDTAKKPEAAFDSGSDAPVPQGQHGSGAPALQDAGGPYARPANQE